MVYNMEGVKNGVKTLLAGIATLAVLMVLGYVHSGTLQGPTYVILMVIKDKNPFGVVFWLSVFVVALSCILSGFRQIGKSMFRIVVNERQCEPQKENISSCGEFSKELEKFGYEVRIIDVATAQSCRFSPFSGMWDVFGNERDSFVEHLSGIFNITVVEEADTHIRIVYAEKEHVGYSEGELQKKYSDFAALLERMEGKVEMKSVFGK